MKQTIALVGLLFIVSCASQSDMTRPRAGTWVSFADEFTEQYFRLHPDFAVEQGRHEYDGQLPDVSREGFAREIAWLRDVRARAAAMPALNQKQIFERDYLIAKIDEDLFWLDTAQRPFRNPLAYNFSPSIYLTREYAPLPVRMRAYTTYLQNLPAAVRHIRANLRTPLARPHVETALGVYRGLSSYLRKDALDIFSSVDDAAMQSQLRQATDAAAKSIDDLAGWMESQLPAATNNYALGPEMFRQMLVSTERVDVSIDELEAAGRRDLERNLAALRDACGRYAPGASVAECAARVEARKPAEGPVAAAQRQLDGMRQFILDRGVVTIPGSERAAVAEAPPYRRTNAAYIEIPGPFEKNLPSTYYIAPPEATWTEAERAAYIPSEAFLYWISVHEVWPGHFLQFLHANRSRSLFGRIFVGYAFAEGWAHYAEEMMWDMGLGNGDAELHIGQLLNALLRDVRYLSAIGLHTRGMTVEESERMFREYAFRDVGNARQQARRGTYDPAYLNYTLGKLMIRKLRDDWTASRGGRAAWREFHDQFLSFGGPPVPLVRRVMMGGEIGSLF
jgi:hypothetical protein